MTLCQNSDVPSVEDQSSRYFLHWAVVNIPMPLINYSEHQTPVYPPQLELSTCDSGNVFNCTNAVGYTSPNPPLGTGAHRYQFLLFWQRARITEKQLVEFFSGKRQKFDPEVLKFNLKMSFTASSSFKCGY